jgi:thioredoxin 1
MNHNVNHVTDAQFDDVIVTSPLTIVDFTANWCPPCRMMDPVYKEMAEKYGSQVQFLKVNGDDNPVLIQRYSIQSLPTFAFFQNGQMISRIIGARPAGQFEAEIQAFMEKVAVAA